jgi:hypothetical protein
VGVPPSDAFLDFHEALAGYVEPAGQDELVYGIIHHDSYWYGSLSPEASRRRGRWYVTYADGHPSYGREMDEDGVMYADRLTKQAASFVSLIEARAFIAEFWSAGATVRKIVRAPPESFGDLRARLDPFRIPELSDGIATVWSTPSYRLLATEAPTWDLWIRPDSPLGDLAPFVQP